jgi:hypothetical protein
MVAGQSVWENPATDFLPTLHSEIDDFAGLNNPEVVFTKR